MFGKENKLNNYKKLNDSFEKTLVFRVGSDSGFFSEYNNMVLMMLYCLKHQIKFEINSSFANFKYQKGWQDYFMPFCKEHNAWFHKKYNRRPYMVKGRMSDYVSQYIKPMYGITYFTQHLWNKIQNDQFEKEKFSIKELGINDGLQASCAVIINEVLWRYQPQVQKEIDARIQSLNLPQEYIGLHIRAGDKHLEDDILPAKDYLETASQISTVRNAFILTDDYSIIESIESEFPEWRIYTLCSKDERGYVNESFSTTTPETKRKMLLNLFASTDVIAKSQKFIGTFSSNVGMFLGMRMNAEDCIGMDSEKWFVKLGNIN